MSFCYLSFLAVVRQLPVLPALKIRPGFDVGEKHGWRGDTTRALSCHTLLGSGAVSLSCKH